MDVSVIIVNYKTTALTVNAIKSIIEQTQGIEFEVIVVDNASQDYCKDKLIGIFHDKVKVLELPQNIGFGRANNEGVKIAQGRNIFFLNPDTILLNNAIQILSKYLDEHTFVGACGGNLYNEQLCPTHSLIRLFPSVLYELNILLGGLPLKLRYGKNYQFNHTIKPIEVAYVLGADLMVKHDIIKQIGGFDERFFMFFEETDLCFRIRKNNWKIMAISAAQIQHLESKSFADTINERRITYFETGRETFYTIHYSKKYHKIANQIYALTIISHQFLSKILFNDQGHTFWKLKKDIFKTTRKKL